MTFIPYWTPEPGDRVRSKEEIITPEGRFTPQHYFEILAVGVFGIELQDSDGNTATVTKKDIELMVKRTPLVLPGDLS